MLWQMLSPEVLRISSTHFIMCCAYTYTDVLYRCCSYARLCQALPAALPCCSIACCCSSAMLPALRAAAALPGCQHCVLRLHCNERKNDYKPSYLRRFYRTNGVTTNLGHPTDGSRIYWCITVFCSN